MLNNSKSFKGLEGLGKKQLSRNFCMRDFLYSDVANFYGVPNIPNDYALALRMGESLCEALLEPLIAVFGSISILSGYRSTEVNELCNKKMLNCSSNTKNYAAHIWDMPDLAGNFGAAVSVKLHWLDSQTKPDWQSMAWFIHDHLPYHRLTFFKGNVFNIGWRDNPEKIITSYISPKGYLTRPGMDNHSSGHSEHYVGYPGYLGQVTNRVNINQ